MIQTQLRTLQVETGDSPHGPRVRDGTAQHSPESGQGRRHDVLTGRRIQVFIASYPQKLFVLEFQNFILKFWKTEKITYRRKMLKSRNFCGDIPPLHAFVVH